MNPARTPVVIGVGQINDRPADPAQGLDPAALAAEALRRADADGGGGWLARADALLAVDQISFQDIADLAAATATRLGIAPPRCATTELPHGDAPIRLLDDAANRIARGESRIELVAGAEALRTAAARPPVAPRHRFAPPSPLAARYGLVAPADIYPLYENATRAAWGQSLAEAQAESAAIWAGMSRVAAGNEHAWLRDPVDAATIATPSPANRPIAHPYTKLMVANSAVNQGAGFIVASLAEARAAGLADEGLVFVGAGAAAHEPDDVLLRDGFAESPAMAASILGALDANQCAPGAIDHVELYSCFPCIPKMARRLIGWPVERPVTAFGGLTFGGGPIGNVMSHAVAAMTVRLRAHRGTALVFANGGYATQNHSILLSRTPRQALPADYDRQHVADAARGPVPPLDPDYAGPATIETYTVLYGRDGTPRHGVIVARTPAGTRTLARVSAGTAATIAFLTDGKAEPIGTAGTITRDPDNLGSWA